MGAAAWAWRVHGWSLAGPWGVAAVKLRNILHLYRVRLRARALQECFAIVGIAAGVALLFASQVATSSLSSSVAQLSRGIVGNATLQLLARDPHGFDASLLGRVRAIPGVHAAAPLLEASANAIGPHGSESVELVGADSSLSRLGGALVRHTPLSSFAGVEAVVLPAPLAHKLGVTKFGQEATFQLNGRVAEAALYEQLHASQIGPLISSPIAVTTLAQAQEMTGLSGRISRVLVEPDPGREAAVRAGLARLAAGRLNGEPASYDETLFARAAAATNQSTALFALISALVGFLFAFNAMLLTVPQRRRLIADLRRDGYPPATVIVVLLFDAVVLGLLACVLGLALGEELSIHLFRSNPGYLSSAFAVGSQRVVSAQSVRSPSAGACSRRAWRCSARCAKSSRASPLGGDRRPGTCRPPRAVCAWARSRLAGSCAWSRPRRSCWRPRSSAILGMVVARRRAAAVAAAAAGGNARARAAARARDRERRPARRRDGAARGAHARAWRSPRPARSRCSAASRSRPPTAICCTGLENAAQDMNAFTDVWVSPAGSYNLLKTAPFPRHRAPGEARAAAGRARGAHLPRRAARLRASGASG